MEYTDHELVDESAGWAGLCVLGSRVEDEWCYCWVC